MYFKFIFHPICYVRSIMLTYVRICLCNYILNFCILYHLKFNTCHLLFAETICFNESLVHANEDQGSLIFTLIIYKPSSTDMTIEITTNGTATGEVQIIVVNVT